MQNRINDDLKSFLKAGKNFEAGVLRLMIAVLRNKEIEKRGKSGSAELIEEEIIEVLRKEAKKRKEAADVYEKGSREDLAEKEKAELAVIKNYLPAEMERGEVEKIVKAAIGRAGAVNVKDFGRAMAEAMKDLKGKADAATVSEIIKGSLGAAK